MKIQVVFTFDTDGHLPYEDQHDPACRQNLHDLFKGIVDAAYERYQDALTHKDGSDLTRQTALNLANADLQLARRIYKSMSVQLQTSLVRTQIFNALEQLLSRVGSSTPECCDSSHEQLQQTLTPPGPQRKLRKHLRTCERCQVISALYRLVAEYQD